MQKAVLLELEMFKRGGELIEMGRQIRANSLKRRRAYIRLIHAVDAKDKNAVRAAWSELKAIKKLKFV